MKARLKKVIAALAPERVIAAISPERALRREIARYERREFKAAVFPGYNGGTISTRRRTNVFTSTASEDMLPGYGRDQLIANAMDAYRNDPLAKAIIDIVATSMGESRPYAVTSDPEWNKHATAYFNEVWWPQADARGRAGVTYGTLQTMWTKASYYMGDQLFVLHHGQLMPYEGILIRTPGKLSNEQNITNGIRLQKAAPHRVTHYYIVQPGTTISNESFHRVRASEAIYAPSEPWRLGSLRGIPYLHSVIDALHDANATRDNIRQKVKFESMLFTVAKKGTLGKGVNDRITNINTSTGTKLQTKDSKTGMHIDISGDTKDFAVHQMNNPGSEAMQWVNYDGEMISAGMGLAYEIVLHRYTKSYTASRATRTDFKAFLMHQWNWRNAVLNARNWNWRIAKAIREGDLPPAPINELTGKSEWHMAKWTKPHLEQIDQGKEVTADIKQWGAGQESLSDWAQQRGTTRAGLLNEHDADIAEFQKRADILKIPLDVYMGSLFKPSTQPAGTETPQTAGSA